MLLLAGGKRLARTESGDETTRYARTVAGVRWTPFSEEAETEPQVQRRYSLRKKGQGIFPLTFFRVRITGVNPTIQ